MYLVQTFSFYNMALSNNLLKMKKNIPITQR